MEVTKALLCRRAHQVGPDDFECIQQFDRLQVQAFPKHDAEISLLIEVRKEPAEPAETVLARLLDPDNHPLGTGGALVFPPDAPKRFTVAGIIPFTGVTWSQPGEHRVVVTAGDEVLWEKSFPVVQRP